MNNFLLTLFGCLILIQPTYATIMSCPDPQTTSLKWGQPPEPWENNPFSPNHPVSDSTTQFVRANILVAGMGRGVLCTYKNSENRFYSIWWQGQVKVPARENYNWIDTNGGFVCADSVFSCQFSVI